MSTSFLVHGLGLIGYQYQKSIFKQGKTYIHTHKNPGKLIAIDEISIGRKHKYLTIVLDLKIGAVVFIGDGKKSNSLKPFWKQIKSESEYKSCGNRYVTKLH